MPPWPEENESASINRDFVNSFDDVVQEIFTRA
jgi:hypothetical protein